MDTTESGSSRPEDHVDAGSDKRTALRVRHAQGLTTLMSQRRDLRGVHALADLVDDAVRWSA